MACWAPGTPSGVTNLPRWPLPLRADGHPERRCCAGRADRIRLAQFDAIIGDGLHGEVKSVSTVPTNHDASRARAVHLASDLDGAAVLNRSGTSRPTVVLLCVHNAGRSQTAAGLMRQLARGRVDVFSGGSEPT